MKKLTPTRRRALEIVRDNPGIRPQEFSKKLWPGHPGHRRHTKCGPKGTTYGGGMRLAAGGYLGKLVHAGLLKYGVGQDDGFHLSAKGQEALEIADSSESP